MNQHVRVACALADELKLSFGGMISTCNEVQDEAIKVTASQPCLWISTLAGVYS
jgi:Thiamin pyrophosphokinase, vitamin B1 binding domain